MKMFRKSSVLLFLCMLITAGCHSQQIPPVSVITAPAVTSTTFAQLNANTPATLTNYVDQPATGSFCYFVQMLDGSGVSPASNVVCGTTTSALKHFALTWSAPAGYVCQNLPCGYVVSRAPAVLTPVGVPTLAPGTQTAGLEIPEKAPEIQLALVMR